LAYERTQSNGVPELLADTVTGRIPYSLSPIGNALGFVKEKRLTALGVTTLVRAPSLPAHCSILMFASLMIFA